MVYNLLYYNVNLSKSLSNFKVVLSFVLKINGKVVALCFLGDFVVFC